MKLNQKDPMQTEEKNPLDNAKLRSTQTTKESFICSRQSSADFLDMAPYTIQSNACLSFRQIQ